LTLLRSYVMPSAQALSEIAIGVSGAAALISAKSARYTRRAYLETTPDLRIRARFQTTHRLADGAYSKHVHHVLAVTVTNGRKGKVEIDDMSLRMPKYHNLPTTSPHSLLPKFFLDELTTFPYLMPGRATRRWRYDVTAHFSQLTWGSYRGPGPFENWNWYWWAKASFRVRLTVKLPTKDRTVRVKKAFDACRICPRRRGSHERLAYGGRPGHRPAPHAIAEPDIRGVLCQGKPRTVDHFKASLNKDLPKPRGIEASWIHVPFRICYR
jgi:hypothetical protein